MDGIKFAKERRDENTVKWKEETDRTFQRKLKWKGVKPPKATDESELNDRKLNWKKREQVKKDEKQ